MTPRAALDGMFDRFAAATSRLVSGGAFFSACVALVVLWIPTIVVLQSVDTWQLVLNTVVSVAAFLLVAVLQNSERRNDLAMHAKLDAIAAGLADLMLHTEVGDRAALDRSIAELRGAVDLDERV